MRKIFMFLLAMPAFAIAQDKNIINVSRYFPKADKVDQFEKAIAAHAQKYHKGDYNWKVFTIETGPDAGGYQVIEGPTNWDAVDKRGDISKEHMDDWNKNVQPLLTDRGYNGYFVFRQDLSTANMGETAPKIMVSHIIQKPGYYGEVQDMYTQMKKTWTDSDQSVAVYESSASGEPQFLSVTLYKQGLKERETSFRPNLPTLFAKANGGENAWQKYIETFKAAVEHQWSEILFYKPELGSK